MKRRFIVRTDFTCWKLGDPETRLPMRRGFHLFADATAPGETVTFDMDAREFEVDRETFSASVEQIGAEGPTEPTVFYPKHN